MNPGLKSLWPASFLFAVYSLQTPSPSTLKSMNGVCPGGSLMNNLPASAGDVCLIPGSGRSPGRGNGNSLQYSWESHEQRSQWATVHGVAKSWTSPSTHICKRFAEMLNGAILLTRFFLVLENTVILKVCLINNCWIYCFM